MTFSLTGRMIRTVGANSFQVFDFYLLRLLFTFLMSTDPNGQSGQNIPHPSIWWSWLQSENDYDAFTQTI